MPELTKQKEKSQRPNASNYWQQRMRSWDPLFTPFTIISFLLVCGILFLPIGIAMLNAANSLYTQKVEYNTDNCTPGPGTCSLAFTLDNDVDGDLYLFYEFTNYHQNNIRYSSSVDWTQMMGTSNLDSSTLTTSCSGAVLTSDIGLKYSAVSPAQQLNPCGLIATSFFTDQYTFSSDNTINGQPNQMIDYDNSAESIAVTIDQSLFVQPNQPDTIPGFQFKTYTSATNACSPASGVRYDDRIDSDCFSAGLPNGCKCYIAADTTETYFYYPFDSTTTYLYEQYPYNISPLVGLTDSHFMNWMNVAALPTFRKLYSVLKGPFKNGDILNVKVNNNPITGVYNNLYTNNFSGKISVVLSAKGGLGVSNAGLSMTFIVSGSIMIISALIFFLKQEIDPRPLGSPKSLNWEQ